MIRALLALVLSCSTMGALAQWWNPASPIAPGKWETLGRNFVYTSQTQQDANTVIQRAILDGDYAKLERMHDEFLAMFLKGGNGDRMYEAFGDAADGYFRIDRGEKAIRFFEEWRQKVPDSKIRPALEAWMWVAKGWQARGGGYASQVSPEAFKIFEADLDRALHVLEEGQATGRQTPLWYQNVIAAAAPRSRSAARIDAVFKEGVERFPRYVPLYKIRVNFLLPQWGGDYGKIDRVIRDGVARTQAMDGTALYATLYASVWESFRGEDFFRETPASWRIMKHAFEDQLANGAVDRNEYATFACIARDRETTRQLFLDLGSRANLGMGRPGITTEECQELVAEGR